MSELVNRQGYEISDDPTAPKSVLDLFGGGGGDGQSLPDGTVNQIVRNNGTEWVSSDDLTNDEVIIGKLSGGTTGQILKKVSATSNDFAWSNEAEGTTPNVTGTATIDNTTGTPTVTTTTTGTVSNPVINFAFTGLKGETGSNGADGTNGTNGTNGVSPTASVAQTTTGATVTITDASGTTTANLTNGADGTNGTNGTNGVSPTASVAQTTTGATVTITDASGTTTANLTNGTDGTVGATPNVTGTATVDSATGTPAVTTTTSGTTSNPVINFAFTGLKGETGATGATYTLTSADETAIANIVLASMTNAETEAL